MTNIIELFETQDGKKYTITAEQVSSNLAATIKEFYAGERIVCKEDVLRSLERLRKNVEENFPSFDDIAENFADELEIKSQGKLTAEEIREAADDETLIKKNKERFKKENPHQLPYVNVPQDTSIISILKDILHTLEDEIVTKRIAAAPERRVFTIETEADRCVKKSDAPDFKTMSPFEIADWYKTNFDKDKSKEISRMMFWDDIEYFVLKAKNNTSPINVSLEQLSLLINAELQAQRQAEKDTSETLSKLISVLSEEYTKACEKMQSDDEKEAFLKDMVHMVASEVITASKKLDEEKSNKGDKND
jgi:hypothetical protein